MYLSTYKMIMRQFVSRRTLLTLFKHLIRYSTSTSSNRVNEGTVSSLHVFRSCVTSTSTSVMAHLAYRLVVRGVRNLALSNDCVGDSILIKWASSPLLSR